MFVTESKLTDPRSVIHVGLLLVFFIRTVPKLCFEKKKAASDALCARCHLPIREGGKMSEGEHDEARSPSMESIA
jgi:hypothetical protein